MKDTTAAPKVKWDKTEIYLRAAFRKVWRWTPSRQACLKDVTACAECKKPARQYFADHIDPVVPVEGLKLVNGHVDYNQYYERMFKGKMQALCKKCHSAKTKAENAERRKIRKEAAANGKT